jgi:S-adenosylhomocysteine hydrolase
MGDAGDLKYPVIAVNDAITKWDFDNVYGTGQSTIDGILRATSVLIAARHSSLLDMVIVAESCYAC